MNETVLDFGKINQFFSPLSYFFKVHSMKYICLFYFFNPNRKEKNYLI